MGRRAVASEAAGAVVFIGEGGSMISKFGNLLKSEDGPTASEYMIVLALIVLAVVGSITLLGNRISEVFLSIAGKLS
jgi:pilus assembly protein Flp/PilA